MKKERLERYFDQILENTYGDNTSNSDIIDYSNGDSLDKEEIKEEYYKYLELQESISDYIFDNDLDNINDQEAIKKYFNNIDEDCFEFNSAFLKDFVDYMCIIINKKNQYKRKANMIFGKNGNGYLTTKITIPVCWAKELGFTEDDKEAIIKLENNAIIIKKESRD